MKYAFQKRLFAPEKFPLYSFSASGHTFPMLNKVNKTALIKLYIEQHPGYTLTEAAKACGVSRAMVSIVRKQLAIADGTLASSRSPAGPLDDGTPSPQTFAEIIRQVLDGKGIKLTPQQQAQVYSGLATHPKAQPGTVISALNGLRALEASAQQTNDIGPGIPLTREGKVHRLSLLLSAVGLDIAAEAWKKAYLTPTPSPETAYGAALLVPDPIPEGPHESHPMAPQSESPPSEGSAGPFSPPMEEPGVS